MAMFLAPPRTVSAEPSGCAVVSISIRTGTETVPPGTTIGIAGGVNNCSSRKERYTVVVSALSSCGQRADIASIRMAFNPGENRIYGVSYPMPADTCAGSWEATVQVREGGPGTQGRDGGRTLASASTSLTIH